MDTPDRKLEPRIDREGLMARLRTITAQPRSESDGITMEVFRRILRALPSRDVEDERQEDEEDGVVDDDLEDGGREGDGEKI